MSTKSIQYTSENFEEVMEFLMKLYYETGSMANWLPDRFEGSEDNDYQPFYLWRDEQKIVAMTALDGSSNYYYFISPEYTYLQEEILDWIDDHAHKNKEKSKIEKYYIMAIEGDEREPFLIEKGYKNEGVYSLIRIWPLDQDLVEFPLVNGYSIRPAKPDDYDMMAQGVRTVFGHGEWFTGEIIEWITQRSFYKQDLDLLVLDKQGELAAFCTFRMDPRSKIIQLEPFATMPKHRRKGLGKALLSDGLRRVLGYEPKLVYIGGAANTPAANALYESTGFTEKIAEYRWSKKL